MAARRRQRIAWMGPCRRSTEVAVWVNSYDDSTRAYDGRLRLRESSGVHIARRHGNALRRRRAKMLADPAPHTSIVDHVDLAVAQFDCGAAERALVDADAALFM